VKVLAKAKVAKHPVTLDLLGDEGVKALTP